MIGPGLLLSVEFTKPFLAAGHFAVEPRTPFAADFNGDGFADLGCVFSSPTTIVDLSLSDAFTKFKAHEAPLRLEGFEAASFALGELAGTAGPDLALLSKDGRLGIGHSWSPGKLEFSEVARGLQVTEGTFLACGDFEGRSEAQILIVREKEPWTFLRRGAEGFEATAVSGPPGLRRLVAWGRPPLVVAAALDAELRLCWVSRTAEGFQIAERTGLAAGAAELLAGDFDGDGRPDLLAGRQILREGDPLRVQEVPAVQAFPEPKILLASDLNKDSWTDLLVCRRDSEPNVSRDILAFLSVKPADPDPDFDGLTNEEEKALATDPLDRDTDQDGLLDGWEVKGAYALDLAAEGCSPRRKDVVCLIQRGNNVDAAALREELRRAQQYFASLPAENPDGSKGIGLILPFLRPLDAAKGEGNKPWWELGEAGIPSSLRGIAHYMVVSRGGGGQSSEMGEMGGIGNGTAYATFLHEFGHQLGLDHSGRYSSWSPMYTSLMNYAYSYGFDGDGAKIHYSSGEFAALPLRESALPEKLPFPIEKLRFLEKDPNRFPIQAEGASTCVDWNRNGRFDAEPVRADINCSYGTDGGLRTTIGKTVFAPVFAARGDRIFLFSVKEGGALERRDYLGEEKWSPPALVKEKGASGDPFFLLAGEECLLFLPVEEGVEFWAGASPEKVERVGLLPESRGAAVSGAFAQGETFVFLYDGPKKPVRVLLRVGAGWERISELPFESAFPPAAAFDPGSFCLLFGIGVDQDEKRRSRWQLVRTRFEAEDRSFLVVDREWVSGEGGSDAGSFRPNLLLEDLGGRTRVHWIATGLLPPQAKSSCFWAAVTVADRGYRGGWLTKRYYDEWTTTVSPAAAAWHGDDIFLAFRWHGDVGERKTDNDLIVSHRGLGVSDQPSGDFDDVSFIAKVGLQRSILWRR